MIDLRLEAQGRRLERVLGGKAKMQVEDPALWSVSEHFLGWAAAGWELGRKATCLIRGAFGTVNEYLPLVYVCLGGQADLHAI